MRSLILAAGLVLAAPALQAADLTIFAAASLKGPLDAAAEAWEAQSGDQVTISYGGSSALAKQILQGAPADVFLSAAENWMDKLVEAKLVQDGTRRDLFGNTLVLIAHDPAAAPVALEGADLPALLAGGKLAMALVDSVPAGQYGKAALESLGVWAGVEPAVAQAENVRDALKLVALGEAPYGIVYATDAAADDHVTVVGTFPADSHKPIVYPAAIMKNAKNAKGAEAFAEFLKGSQAKEVFKSIGFAIPAK